MRRRKTFEEWYTPVTESGCWLWLGGLAAVILIPVWGLAESSPNCTSENSGACRILTNPDPLVCDEELNCVQLSCVQRMREAMRSANTYLQGPWNNAWKEAAQWGQTMKDCVEGK